MVDRRGFSACRNPGLNQGPLDLQSNALPTELFRPTRDPEGACDWSTGLEVAMLMRTPTPTPTPS